MPAVPGINVFPRPRCVKPAMLVGINPGSVTERVSLELGTADIPGCGVGINPGRGDPVVCIRGARVNPGRAVGVK